MASGSRHTSRSASAPRCIALHRAALWTVGLFWPCLSGQVDFSQELSCCLTRLPFAPRLPTHASCLTVWQMVEDDLCNGAPIPLCAPFGARLNVQCQQCLREGRIEITRATALGVRAAPASSRDLSQLLGAIARRILQALCGCHGKQARTVLEGAPSPLYASWVTRWSWARTLAAMRTPCVKVTR